MRNHLTLSMLVVSLCLAAVGAQGGPDAEDAKTYAERLGWPPGSRVVIFHIDDAGMCHDANVGVIEAIEKGVATSTSIMMPCAWVSEYAKYLKEHPETDAGIHLTLTSEWDDYRWGPLAGKSAVPGLVDEEGCFWPDVPQVMLKATPDEVETEIRAQIDRCRAMGIEPTHLDSHMGTLFAAYPFFERYLKVGIETGIPILVPAGHMHHISKGAPVLVEVARQMGEKAWEAGLPVVDDIHADSYDWKSRDEKKAKVIEFLRTLRPGITEFVVHCTKPSESFKYISDSGPTRDADLLVMTDPEVKKVIEEESIILTTWRELKQRRDQVDEPR